MKTLRIIFFCGLCWCMMQTESMAQDENENAVWSQQVYRVVPVGDRENGGLREIGNTSLAELLLTAVTELNVPLYDYHVSGLAVTDESHLADIEGKLKDLEIPYTKNMDSVTIRQQDMPIGEINDYYMMEEYSIKGEYAGIRRELVALCPVISREDEFGDTIRYPIGWVRMRDVKGFLNGTMIHAGRNGNTAVRTTMEDFLSAGLYGGKIYMTFSAQGNMKMAVTELEREKITSETMQHFREVENAVFGNKEEKTDEILLTERTERNFQRPARPQILKRK